MLVFPLHPPLGDKQHADVAHERILRAGDGTELAECLSNIHKTLGSTMSTAKE